MIGRPLLEVCAGAQWDVITLEGIMAIIVRLGGAQTTLEAADVVILDFGNLAPCVQLLRIIRLRNRWTHAGGQVL